MANYPQYRIFGHEPANVAQDQFSPEQADAFARMQQMGFVDGPPLGAPMMQQAPASQVFDTGYLGGQPLATQQPAPQMPSFDLGAPMMQEQAMPSFAPLPDAPMIDQQQYAAPEQSAGDPWAADQLARLMEVIQPQYTPPPQQPASQVFDAGYQPQYDPQPAQPSYAPTPGPPVMDVEAPPIPIGPAALPAALPAPITDLGAPQGIAQPAPVGPQQGAWDLPPPQLPPMAPMLPQAPVGAPAGTPQSPAPTRSFNQAYQPPALPTFYSAGLVPNLGAYKPAPSMPGYGLARTGNPFRNPAPSAIPQLPQLPALGQQQGQQTQLPSYAQAPSYALPQLPNAPLNEADDWYNKMLQMQGFHY